MRRLHTSRLITIATLIVWLFASGHCWAECLAHMDSSHNEGSTYPKHHHHQNHRSENNHSENHHPEHRHSEKNTSACKHNQSSSSDHNSDHIIHCDNSSLFLVDSFSFKSKIGSSVSSLIFGDALKHYANFQFFQLSIVDKDRPVLSLFDNLQVYIIGPNSPPVLI